MRSRTNPLINRITRLPQQPAAGAFLYSRPLTVRENLLLRGAIYGEGRNECLRSFDRVCDILSLGDITEKRYKKLSGGQKRKCEIAAALMHSPELLFLDEPTTGLQDMRRGYSL